MRITIDSEAQDQVAIGTQPMAGGSGPASLDDVNSTAPATGGMDNSGGEPSAELVAAVAAASGPQAPAGSSRKNGIDGGSAPTL